MLRDVFAECVRVLEPGGRIAVNVANLGRKPVPLAGQRRDRHPPGRACAVLRGEVVCEGQGRGGLVRAPGSYMKASNPVLRDLSERVVVAPKGRFDRAIPVKKRAARGLRTSRRSARRIPRADARRGRSAPSGRRRAAPGAVPGRAARALHPALHVPRRRRARPLPGIGFHGVAAAPRPALRGLRPRPAYVEIAEQRVDREGRA